MATSLDRRQAEDFIRKVETMSSISSAASCWRWIRR